MDIYHNTFLKFILEDDSIFSTSRARIHSCSDEGPGLWLVARPSTICFASHVLFSPQCYAFV
jgi:hypothetical protein